jgi:RNA polymerase sigma factor (sigma-70 family)
MNKVVSELVGQERKLLSYIFRRDRNKSRSEDILQEVMLRVVEQSRKQEISNPMAYAYRVADSVIFAQARKVDAEAEPLDDQFRCDLPLADEILQHKERVRIFQTALSKLTPLQREVFLKRHLDGKSRQEIALELNMNLEAVKKHLVRSMAEMARAIERAGLKHGGSTNER